MTCVYTVHSACLVEKPAIPDGMVQVLSRFLACYASLANNRQPVLSEHRNNHQCVKYRYM